MQLTASSWLQESGLTMMKMLQPIPKQNLSCIYMFYLNFRMPRSWKRKMDRGVSLNVVERASNDVKEHGKSIRSVAKLYGIYHVTLHG